MQTFLAIKHCEEKLLSDHKASNLGGRITVTIGVKLLTVLIVHMKTYSQLLPFYLLVGHARIIGVELKSLGLQALDKLLVV